MEVKTNDKNKEFWNSLNSNYAKAWESPAKEYMSRLERDFILSSLHKTAKRKVLDIGVGLGRILNFYLESTPQSELYGVDIAENMLSLTRERFKDNSQVKRLVLCDVAKEPLPGDELYDFVSCIRVMHYNQNWDVFLTKVKERLAINGVFVFTMANRNSLNVLRPSDIPFYRTSVKELKRVLQEHGLELIELDSFTRIPDFLYHLNKSNAYARVIIGIEKFLRVILGKTFLGRVLFVAVRKGD